jgi:hypothetical protein
MCIVFWALCYLGYNYGTVNVVTYVCYSSQGNEDLFNPTAVVTHSLSDASIHTLLEHLGVKKMPLNNDHGGLDSGLECRTVNKFDSGLESSGVKNFDFNQEGGVNTVDSSRDYIGVNDFESSPECGDVSRFDSSLECGGVENFDSGLKHDSNGYIDAPTAAPEQIIPEVKIPYMVANANKFGDRLEYGFEDSDFYVQAECNCKAGLYQCLVYVHLSQYSVMLL